MAVAVAIPVLLRLEKALALRVLHHLLHSARVLALLGLLFEQLPDSSNVGRALLLLAHLLRMLVVDDVLRLLDVASDAGVCHIDGRSRILEVNVGIVDTSVGFLDSLVCLFDLVRDGALHVADLFTVLLR